MKKLTHPEHIRGHLIIIGGAEDKYNERYILRKFLAMAGGEDASVLVIPIASDFPEFSADLYRQVFKHLGVSSIKVLNVATRMEAMAIDPAEMLDGITGVFISGGDQMRIAAVLGGTEFADAMVSCVKDGMILAGSSAGAAAMSGAMIVRGEPTLQPNRESIRLSPGLGVLPNVVIDQHFTERHRLTRLITAVCYNPANLGIGIDENTAIIVSYDGVLEVAGAGTVTIVDGSGITHNDIAEVSATRPFSVSDLRLHILRNDQRYDLVNRRPLEVSTDFLPG